MSAASRNVWLDSDGTSAARASAAWQPDVVSAAELPALDALRELAARLAPEHAAELGAAIDGFEAELVACLATLVADDAPVAVAPRAEVPQPPPAAPADPAQAGPATLDPAALAVFEARERAGRAGLVARMVAGYREQSQQLCDRIERGYAAGDAGEVAFGAHALKSSSAVIGAGRLTELCRRVEQGARSGSLAGLAAPIGELLELNRGVLANLAARYPHDSAA